MSRKRWVLRPVTDESSVKSLSESLNIPETLARLLVIRNIRTFSEAKDFFRPSLQNLHDPFLMNGMHEATSRVIKAVADHEQILIYGDYDVDGTCSTALMYMFLKSLGANVSYYIPRRLEEGYGISRLGIDHAKKIGTTLMISVDCGITAVEETDYANQLGIDVVICDHHQPKDTIPNGYAVLDPLKPGCEYPFKYLSGAGVAFKLAQGICQRIGKNEEPYKYLDLVALAGAADIVPLENENRILVKEGLINVNQNPRPGIRALMKAARLEPGSLTSAQIVFTIAPRINAVGRLGDASTAVKLLITESEEEAALLAAQLESDNSERKKIDEETVNEAIYLIETDKLYQERGAIILHEENWHPGVIGIVASRIVEKYYRPTIMLTTIDGVAKGSARSISHFNIYEALKGCEDLLLHYGGHEAAAGLAVELDKLDEFKFRFNKIVSDKLSEELLTPPLEVDAKIKFSEITPKFIRIIEQFAPFGPANMRPVFWTENVKVSGYVRVAAGKHLMFTVKQEGCDKVFDVVGFDFGSFAAELNNGHPTFDMVFSIDHKTREGKNFPQFRIRDLRLK